MTRAGEEAEEVRAEIRRGAVAPSAPSSARPPTMRRGDSCRERAFARSAVAG